MSLITLSLILSEDESSSSVSADIKSRDKTPSSTTSEFNASILSDPPSIFATRTLTLTLLASHGQQAHEPDSSLEHRF